MTTPRDIAQPGRRSTTRSSSQPERRSGSDQGLVRPTCPVCNNAVYRVPRRFTDRLLSLFKPVLRYTCRSALCTWEGTLRNVRQASAKPSSRFVDGNRRYLLEPSRGQPPAGSLTDT